MRQEKKRYEISPRTANILAGCVDLITDSCGLKEIFENEFYEIETGDYERDEEARGALEAEIYELKKAFKKQYEEAKR